MTYIHYVQRLANVTKIAKFNLLSIYNLMIKQEKNDLMIKQDCN